MLTPNDDTLHVPRWPDTVRTTYSTPAMNTQHGTVATGIVIDRTPPGAPPRSDLRWEEHEVTVAITDEQMVLYGAAAVEHAYSAALRRLASIVDARITRTT